MNQTQYEKEIDKAEQDFKTIVGACYLFLRENSTCSTTTIIKALHKGIDETIKEILEKEDLKNDR